MHRRCRDLLLGIVLEYFGTYSRMPALVCGGGGGLFSGVPGVFSGKRWRRRRRGRGWLSLPVAGR